MRGSRRIYPASYEETDESLLAQHPPGELHPHGLRQ